jgi:pectate disaccharide-lyase
VSPPGGEFAAGTQVTLTAAPGPGYTFNKWGGNVSSADSTVTFTMNSNKTVSAIFILATPVPPPIPVALFPLKVSVSPPGSGTVSPNGGLYASGTQVTLTATPAPGYTFSNWSGNTRYSPLSSLTSPTTTVTVWENANIVANFAPVPTP